MCARVQTSAVDGARALLLALYLADRSLSENFRDPMKESAHVHSANRFGYEKGAVRPSMGASMSASAKNCRSPAAANPDFPPWAYVRSTELAQLCGVSMQTVWNWRVRNQGPPSVQDRSRRHWYRLADVQSWQQGGSISSDAIIMRWLDARFPWLKPPPEKLHAAINQLELASLVPKTRRPKSALKLNYLSAV